MTHAAHFHRFRRAERVNLLLGRQYREFRRPTLADHGASARKLAHVRQAAPKAKARPRRFRAELAVFIGGADVAAWLRPVRDDAGALMFRFLLRDGSRALSCTVKPDGACSCGEKPRCEHVRALRALHLIS